MRWALVALGVFLGGLLIARGNVVIGAVVLLMAVLRGSVFLQWQRRRQALRRRFPNHPHPY